MVKSPVTSIPPLSQVGVVTCTFGAPKMLRSAARWSAASNSVCSPTNGRKGLGLTAPGTAEKFILDGDNTYGGRVVTNPSGGLLSKGHPLGATGLAQCSELVWQLRGQADQRHGDHLWHGRNL